MSTSRKKYVVVRCFLLVRKNQLALFSTHSNIEMYFTFILPTIPGIVAIFNYIPKTNFIVHRAHCVLIEIPESAGKSCMILTPWKNIFP